MTDPHKQKGDRAEREVAALLADNLGVPARRKLGAGRLDDQGDIDGVPATVIQCVSYRDLARALREKPPEAERQRLNAGAQFAATFIRKPGGTYVVALTPDQFFTLWREATA